MLKFESKNNTSLQNILDLVLSVVLSNIQLTNCGEE